LNKSTVKLLFIGLPLLLVAVIWSVDAISETPLILDVPLVSQIGVFETRWLYFAIHLFSFIPVFLLSFDKRVHYYTSWKNLFPAILLIAIPFILWDIIFTTWQVWGFNEMYHQVLTVFGLPIEEILFFIVIPFSSIFIYQCLHFYFPRDLLAPVDKWISVGLGVLLILVGMFYWNRIYTSTTFLFTGAFMILHYLYFENTYRTKFYLSYLITWVPFLLVDGVLTGGYSKQPIVIYHPEEFLNLRITSVPLEDSIYGLLLLMLNMSLFMHFEGGNKVRD